MSKLAVANNFIIKSTCFGHKKVHTGAWKMPGTGSLNKINHVLISKEHVSSIIDVYIAQGPNCDSVDDVLQGFERKIIRRIHGPVCEDGEWRTGSNQEIDHIRKSEDTVRFVKSLRLSWLGQKERMEESRVVTLIHTVLVRK
jgi:hypothetical protein